MVTFIVLRLLDTFTTILNVSKYGGWEVELNPYMRWIGSAGLFIPYQLLITCLAVLILNRFKYKKVVYTVMSVISLIVVLVNIYCLTL